MQKVAKNRHLGTTAQLRRAISSQLMNVSTIGKNLLSSNISFTCPYNMVNFGPLVAEILLLVWGTPANFNGFRVLAALYCTASSCGRQPNFAALNRGCYLCSAGRPSRWALAHISSFVFMSSFYRHQIDRVQVLRPTRHKIGHLGDIILSESLGVVLKKLNLTQRKQTTQEQKSVKLKQKNTKC